MACGLGQAVRKTYGVFHRVGQQKTLRHTFQAKPFFSIKAGGAMTCVLTIDGLDQEKKHPSQAKYPKH